MAVYPSRDIERQALEEAALEDAGHSVGVEAGDGCCRARACDKASAREAARPVARISRVAPGSPAYDAGFEAGCAIVSVDGLPVRDVIDWRWLASEDVASFGYIDLDGEEGEVELEREEGEDWGFEFDGVVFDGVKQCRNACSFCFMRQLPQGMRPSLTLRDDDFRLSFLSGTFVTLTNLTPDDEARILEQRISPLRVSLHAVDPEVRRSLIGRHAQHGLDALDRLLAAGIEVHAQIVLVPGENDGSVLERTLEWAWARPGVLNVGIVPLGYTRHQTRFSKSFNDAAEALAVVDSVASFQKRAQDERGFPWVYAADELYRSAFGEELLDKLPPGSHYGDFSMFEDGIGIIRSYVDDFFEAEKAGLFERFSAALEASRRCGGPACVRLVVGEAMQPFLDQLIRRSALSGSLVPLTVKNDFFGGNVDVTGLLCGCDMAAAIAKLEAAARKGESEAQVPEDPRLGSRLYVVPRVVFNDDGVTLDGMSLADVEKAAGARMAVVSCNASDYLVDIIELLEDRP